MTLGCVVLILLWYIIFHKPLRRFFWMLLKMPPKNAALADAIHYFDCKKMMYIVKRLHYFSIFPSCWKGRKPNRRRCFVMSCRGIFKATQITVCSFSPSYMGGGVNKLRFASHCKTFTSRSTHTLKLRCWSKLQQMKERRRQDIGKRKTVFPFDVCWQKWVFVCVCALQWAIMHF